MTKKETYYEPDQELITEGQATLVTHLAALEKQKQHLEKYQEQLAQDIIVLGKSIKAINQLLNN